MSSAQPSVVQVMGWHSQQYGSFERFLVALSTRLRDRGAAVHLVFPEAPASEEFVRDCPATFHQVPLTAFPGDVRPVARLRRLYVRVGATHVHAHFGADAYLALVAARLARVPRRFTSKHAMPGVSRLTAARARHRWLGRQVERIFAVSDPVARGLIALGVDPAAIDVVNLGVDFATYRRPPETRHATRRALGIGEEERVVLSLSHHRPGKGTDLLPVLAERLGDLVPPVRVVSAGDGPLRATVAGQAAGLRTGRLDVLGVRHDVPDLLTAADVFVLPTTASEGAPLSTLEALAAAVPVVATTPAATNLDERFSGLVRVVPPGDVGALAAACAAILEDLPGARDRAEQARARALADYGVDSAVDFHVQAYFAQPPRR